MSEDDIIDDHRELENTELSYESLSKLALYYNEIKKSLVGFGRDRGDDLDKNFEMEMQKSIGNLEIILKDLEAEDKDKMHIPENVHMLRAKHNISAHVFRLLCRMVRYIDPMIGDFVKKMYLSEQNDFMNMSEQYDNVVEKAQHYERELISTKSALEAAEDNCDKLTTLVRQLNDEATESATTMEAMQKRLNSCFQLLSTGKYKDKLRKSALGVSTIAAIKAGATLVDKPVVGDRSIYSSFKSFSIRSRSPSKYSGRFGDINDGTSTMMAPTTIDTAGTNTVDMNASLMTPLLEDLINTIGDSKDSLVKKSYSPTRVYEPDHRDKDGHLRMEIARTQTALRADSSLGWLNIYRRKVSDLQDEFFLARRLLTARNCIASIEHIYAEKAKFEHKSAMAKGAEGMSMTKTGTRKDKLSLSGKNNMGVSDAIIPLSAYSALTTGPIQETMERFLFRMLDKRFGSKKIALEHAATLTASLQEYSPRFHEVAIFRALVNQDIDEQFYGVIEAIKETLKNLLLANVRAEGRVMSTEHEMHELNWRMGIAHNALKGGGRYGNNYGDKEIHNTQLDFDERDRHGNNVYKIPQNGGAGWEEMVNYLFEAEDAVDCRKRVFETAVNVSVKNGELTPNEADIMLGQIIKKLKQPDHKGNLGYTRPTDPAFTIKKAPPVDVTFKLLIDVVCMFALEQRIRLLGPIREVFDFCDRDEDGIISRVEMYDFLLIVKNRKEGTKGFESVVGLEPLLEKIRGIRRDGLGEDVGGIFDGGLEGDDGEATIFTKSMKSSNKGDKKMIGKNRRMTIMSNRSSAQSTSGGTAPGYSYGSELDKFDPYHIDRICFSTAVNAYLSEIPPETLLGSIKKKQKRILDKSKPKHAKRFLK